MRRYAEPKDAQLKQARKGIEEVAKECDRPWFERLLHILEQDRYATVTTTDGRPVDVQAVAYTATYASFFDILNHAIYFNTDVFPTEVENLSNTYDSAFDPLPPRRPYSERLTRPREYPEQELNQIRKDNELGGIIKELNKSKQLWE
jgi:hypothetical protein